MMAKFILVFGLLLMFYQSANAEWTQTGLVKVVQPHPSRNVVYVIHTKSSTQTLCAQNDVWVLDKNDPLFNQTMSVLLVALSTQLPIKLKSIACEAPSGRPLVNTVMLCADEPCSW